MAGPHLAPIWCEPLQWPAPIWCEPLQWPAPIWRDRTVLWYAIPCLLSEGTLCAVSTGSPTWCGHAELWQAAPLWECYQRSYCAQCPMIIAVVNVNTACGPSHGYHDYLWPWNCWYLWANVNTLPAVWIWMHMSPSLPHYNSHHSSLITHHSLLITHHSSLITHHSSLITHHSSLITCHIHCTCTYDYVECC